MMITIRIAIVGLGNDNFAALMLQVNHKPQQRCMSKLCGRHNETSDIV